MRIILSKYRFFKVFVALVFLMGGTTSCEDFLNQTPTDGLVYSEYWKNKEEVLATLSGAYMKFAELDYLLFVHGELRGDMLKENSTITGSQERNMMSANITPSHNYAKWDDFYSVINICNHVIDLAPGVQAKDATFSDYLLQQYVSEATFIRSLTYFYLVRIFQDVPYVTQPSSNDRIDFFVEKTNGEEILAAVKADLNAVRNLMPEHPTTEMSKSRATKGAANALLADICLWQFEYDQCIEYIDEVEKSLEYFLVPSLEWYGNYNPGFSLENIFEIYYSKPEALPNSFALKTYSSTRGRAPFFASDYAVEVLGPDLDQAGEEIRGEGSLSDNNIDDYQIWKYIGELPDRTTTRSSATDASANFIIYRLADLYLMKAEAYSQKENPNFTDASKYLSLVSERVLMDPHQIYSDAEKYEEVILEERAKELAFEGKRWYDLLRMGRRSEQGKIKLIEILITNVPSTQKLVMKSKLSDPNGWYMPIHRDEINRNVNLTQNTYYDEY